MAEGHVDKISDFGDDDRAVVARWLAEVRAYDHEYKDWSDRAKRVVARYRDEREANNESARRFNILWSNIQTLQPALLARTPVPQVSRRHNDKDPLGRAAATILERAVATCIDGTGYDFDSAMKAARDDYLLASRGTAWVRYVPTLGEAEGEGEDAYRPVVDESVVTEHVHFDDFGHTPAPCWEKVRAVWRKVRMTRDEMEDRFGEKGRKVSLTETAKAVDAETADKFGDVFKRGLVYEIWDKAAREVIWISPGFNAGALDRKKDPLHLREFFPCPKPLYGTMSTDTLVPVPDYAEYQSQALEIDELTERISLLTEALKVAGVYDSSLDSGQLGGNIQSLLAATGENKLYPVDNWAAFAEKGGFKGAVAFLPIEEIARVLVNLIEVRERMKQDLYELSGLSDIVRGQGDADETATAQRIKGNFATMRLDDKRDEVARFVRDTLRIKSEIVAEHFSPETLADMSGWHQTDEAQEIQAKRAEAEQAALQIPAGQAAPPLPPSPDDIFAQAVEMLKSDRMRTFRLDIETDSTVNPDQQQEQQARVEFLGAVGQFLDRMVMAQQQAPALSPLLGELLQFGVRGFKVGREVEARFEEAMEHLRQAPAQQPGQAEQQAAQAQAQADAQTKQAEIAARQQSEAEKLALEREKIAGEQQLKREEIAQRGQIEALKLVDQQQAREAQRQQQLVDQQTQRAQQVEDAERSRGHALEDRRLDGKPTPTMEDDLKELGEVMTMLGQMMQQQAAEHRDTVQAIIESNRAQTESLMQALLAPKELVRDAQGKPQGVRTVVH